MKKIDLGIYITCSINGDDVRFLRTYNEYAWDNKISDAHKFETVEEAEEILKSDYFTKRVRMSSGTLYAPFILRLAACIDNDTLSQQVSINIVKITLDLDLIKGKSILVYDIHPTPAEGDDYKLI